MEGEGPKRLQLSMTGPADVTAGDIAVTGDIEVLNKDLLICHLDEGATLNMELTADTGKGYVPAVQNRPVDAPIGLIPVDSLYSPIKQVSYKVGLVRPPDGGAVPASGTVGARRRLPLAGAPSASGARLRQPRIKSGVTIETDGTVTPEDAGAYAARILQD